MSAKKNPQGKQPASGAGEEDDLHRKYREALDRKKTNDSAPEGQRGTGKGPGGGNQAGHTQRMFRRKSG